MQSRTAGRWLGRRSDGGSWFACLYVLSGTLGWTLGGLLCRLFGRPFRWFFCGLFGRPFGGFFGGGFGRSFGRSQGWCFGWSLGGTLGRRVWSFF